MNNALSDSAIREQALDPELCCIVQAPAGSGKTELLIQRILVLLTRVERPEEILAITFTKKAAGEMRSRVLKALHEAEQPLAADTDPHLLRQRERALAALAHDRKQGWNLLQQPARLGIQTIDSLCASLAARLPLTAGFGAPSAIDNTPQTLYLEAATQVLALIETQFDEDDADARALEILLPHLGNNLARVRDLLAAMLARRDQWLRHTQNVDRRALEAALVNQVDAELDRLHRLLPSGLRDEISTVAATLCAHLEQQGVDDGDARMHWQVKSWPAPLAAELGRWQGLANLLLTQGGTWLKSPNKNHGVPAPGDAPDKEGKAERKAFKERFLRLLAELGEHDGLEQALHACRSLPAPRYAQNDWDVLAALLQLLNLAVAELNLIFAMRGTADYVENALAAQRALGNGLGDGHDEPSDLLLALDYRLRHILIDEFQDTSTTQFELLKRLIAGWQPGESAYSEAEGRSLFLVGDPMQSIYRFREAEVGLFLLAQTAGVGEIRLKPLELSTNFRSQAGIVDWVNRVFPQVLAPADNIFEGAVRYAEPAAVAFHPEAEGEAVRLHLLDRLTDAPDAEDDDIAERGMIEAEHLVGVVQQTLAELESDGEQVKESDRSIAILVRSRSHLARIIPALRKAGIALQAVEIERLAEQPMVLDLLALTRALLHPADRIAWLAVLRAPWCGLPLNDLLTLVANAPEDALWRLMQDEARLAGLTEDARTRLLHLRTLMARSLAESGRVPLRRQVEGLWLALGGASCVTDARELTEAEIYFDLLDALHQEHGGEIDAPLLEKALQDLYAPADSPKAGQPVVQLMTIHKSKGLQFHSVILPGLARTPPNGESRLLLWREVENAQGESELLLAPIKAVGEGKEQKSAPSLYAWLQTMDARREAHETSRLLYVAATRAIQRLHLIAEAPRDKNGAWNAPARSLLHKLWPGIAFMLNEAPPPATQQTANQAGTAQTESLLRVAGASRLRRIAQIGAAPTPPATIELPQREHTLRPSTHAIHNEDWRTNDETPRHVGTLLHRLFERIALDGLQTWDAHLQQPNKLTPMLSRELLRLGLAAPQLDGALEQVFKALSSTLADPRGRWILSAHEDARCEWALGGLIEYIPVNAIIDRSFIDQGTRWIIDYKTASPQPLEEIEHFLDRQQELYRAQLESYASLLCRQDASIDTKLGLYFPALAQWREWNSA
ncbi:MAG: UvrD-helicase domain-containing protein [Pseudomonadota bacterium]